MKFTLSWLKEFFETDCSPKEIYNTLNKIGLEVDAFVDYGEKYKDFYCVLVENVEKHPKSDHLSICKVKDKDQNLLTIICGAPNVKTGMKTILSPVGSILPNGMEIKKAKICGVESFGMLCSGKELELSEDSDGIIEIDNSIEIGTNVAKIFNLNDVLFEIAITPNKGDCLSIYGIARELASAGIGKLKKIENKTINANFKSEITLKVEDKNCPVFSFREIKNLKNCESPEWLKQRLSAIGHKTRNALVDIGNYVMFTFNTPLHCYDADKIEKEIKIFSAIEGEKFIDLFEKEHILPANSTLIVDKNKNLCLAGIIGSNTSSSDIETKRILVECAIFDEINIAKTGRKINLQTDSRYRFERGSDYNAIDFALTYICNLIQNICGGEISEVVRYEDKDYKNKTIKFFDLKLTDIKNLIGIEIEKNIVLNILKINGYEIKELADNNTLNLLVPSWKNNILVKEDIIDDIVRFYGYDNLQDGEFLNTKKYEKKDNNLTTNFNNKVHKIRKQLVSNGLNEVVSYSFLKKQESSLFEKTNDNLELLNPITVELSYLRQNILTNLINIIKKNNNRGFENLSFFEVGSLFTTNDCCKEKFVIGGVRTGNINDKNIYNDDRKFDVFDVKKDLFDILTLFNINGEKLLLERNIPDYYHPTKSASIKLGKTLLGYFGEINPKILKEFDIKEKVVAFELFLDNIPEKLIFDDIEKKAFKVNDLQPVYRSFAFIIKKGVEVGKIINEIYNVEKDFITNVKLFDLYQESKDSEEKSIAFTITIQPKIVNLSKEDVDKISDKVIDFLKNQYKAILRDGK